MILTTERVREVLGLEFCRTCNVETMPDDRTGKCFFCDQPVNAPPKRVRLEKPPVHPEGCCEFCGTPREGKWARQRFCSQRCRQAFWVRFTPAGRAWVARSNEKKEAA